MHACTCGVECFDRLKGKFEPGLVGGLIRVKFTQSLNLEDVIEKQSLHSFYFVSHWQPESYIMRAHALLICIVLVAATALICTPCNAKSEVTTDDSDPPVLSGSDALLDRTTSNMIKSEPGPASRNLEPCAARGFNSAARGFNLNSDCLGRRLQVRYANPDPTQYDPHDVLDEANGGRRRDLGLLDVPTKQSVMVDKKRRLRGTRAASQNIIIKDPNDFEDEANLSAKNVLNGPPSNIANSFTNSNKSESSL